MIKYKDLSGWLKLAAISGWVYFGIVTLSFLIGFIIGIFEYI